MPKPLEWRVSRETFFRYSKLMDDLRIIDDPECDAHWAIVDDVKNLPGFPHGYDWETSDIWIDVYDDPKASVLVQLAC